MVVLDASAVLALLQDEPGTDAVAAALASSAISAVTFSEVWQKLLDRGSDPAGLTGGLQALGMSVVPFEAVDAVRAAELRAPTRDRGLSLADRACLALGVRLDQAVMTADRAWTGLDVGVPINHRR